MKAPPANQRLAVRISRGVGLIAVLMLATYTVWVLLDMNRQTVAMQLTVDEQFPRLLFDVSDAHSPQETYKRTQAELIRAPIVLNAALEKPEVAGLPLVQAQEQPLEWLRKDLKTTVVDGVPQIGIEIQGTDPDQLVTLLDAIGEAYKETMIDPERQQRQERIEKLKALNDSEREKLAALQSQLIAMDEATQPDAPPSAEAVAIRREIVTLSEFLNQLQRELLESEVEMHRSPEASFTKASIVK